MVHLNETELIEYLLEVYGVFYSPTSVVIQLIMCFVAILFYVVFTITVSTTPFQLSCRVILLANSVASSVMITVHIIRSLVTVIELPTKFATDLVFYSSMLHGAGDGLFTGTLFLLLLERNFAIRHLHAFEKHRRRYYGLFLILLISAVFLSLIYGFAIYFFSFNIYAGLGNNLLLLTTAAMAVYTFYDARRLYSVGKEHHTLETRYRLSEGMELSRSIAPVCISCCALKARFSIHQIIGMAPLWVGQFYEEFLLFALWMYYFMNTVSVLVCAALLMTRNRAMRKRLSILSHLKCLAPPVEFNTDTSTTTYFTMLEQHWK